MTSKEALRQLKMLRKHCEFNNWDGCYIYLELMDGAIENLKALEILKKHIYFSSKSGCIRMKDIYKSIDNFDFEDLKEWLEYENKI